MTRSVRRPPVRAVAGKAFPLYLSLLATNAGTLVTAGVLGHTGTAELAAHALVAAFLVPALMLVEGALRGSMPFFSAHGDAPRDLLPVLRDALWLALLLGAAGGVVLAAVPLSAQLFGVASDTRAALGPYPLFAAAHVVLAAVEAALVVLLVGLGHSRSVMALSVIATALALTLTPTLVLGLGPLPRLSLLGAGVSMLVTGATGVLFALCVVRRATVLRGHRIGLGAPRRLPILRIARVGLPNGAGLLVKFGAMSALAVVVARIGAQEAAAHQRLVMVTTLAFLPAAAVGQASIPFTARTAAAGDRSGVRGALAAGYLVALPVVAAGMLAVWALAEPLAGLLTDDPAVRSAFVSLVPLLAVVVLFDAVQVLPGLALVGLRNSVPTLYAFVVCYGLLALAALPATAAGGLLLLWCCHALATAGMAMGVGTAFRVVSGRVRAEPAPAPSTVSRQLNEE